MSQVRANPLLFSVLAHSLLLVLPLAAMKPHLPTLPSTMTVSLMPGSTEMAKAAIAAVKATALPVPQTATPTISNKREVPTRAITLADRVSTPTSETAPSTNTNMATAAATSSSTAQTTATVAPTSPKTPDSNALALYGQALSELFARQQRYPRLAEMRGWEGDVLLQLRIARKGALLDVQVSHSSGFDILDRSAMQLVQGSPLPPLPAALGQGGDDELKITVPIHYRLSRRTS